MENIVKAVYDVFGPECPDRSFYSSCAQKPFPALKVMKEFNTWAKFKSAYTAHAVQERNRLAAAKIVTKGKPDVAKK